MPVTAASRVQAVVGRLAGEASDRAGSIDRPDNASFGLKARIQQKELQKELA
jgi:hypothetical protein